MALSPKVAQAFMNRYGSLPPEFGSTYLPQATGLSEAADPSKLSSSLAAVAGGAKDAAGGMGGGGGAKAEPKADASNEESRAMQNAKKQQIDMRAAEAPKLKQAYDLQTPDVSGGSLAAAYQPQTFSQRVAANLPSLKGFTPPGPADQKAAELDVGDHEFTFASNVVR